MNKRPTTKPKSEEKQPPAAKAGPVSELQELYKFMQSNGLEALELDRKDYHVRLVRQGRATVPVPVPYPMAGASAAAPSAAQAAAPVSAPAAHPANAHVVKSPMMGIFYRATSPSSPPFIKEGDAVKAGDVLCLIEAMKVFNDVKAEVGGVVSRVLLENGKPVKVGQELFLIEKR